MCISLHHCCIKSLDGIKKAWSIYGRPQTEGRCYDFPLQSGLGKFTNCKFMRELLECIVTNLLICTVSVCTLNVLMKVLLCNLYGGTIRVMF